MANQDDYLSIYREFFKNFVETVNPNDQLPVKLASYKLVNLEVVGAIIDWTTQYLNQKQCPKSLMAPIIKIVIDEIRKECKKEPISCGFSPSENAYQPLRMMQTVMAKTNEICLRYLDNSMLCTLPSPGPPYNIVSACAIRNRRRSMEDRHVIIHDLNTMFNIQEASPSSYYAIFDGHAGHDAAAYSAAHLHQYLAESKYFVSNPKQALEEAFCKTDALFLEKCKVEHFSSGTTAVCALLQPKEKVLYIAWVGDSQAVLCTQGRAEQCVEPHIPNRADEKGRIEQAGGAVIFWGTWRVNGQLAVSRAIGDSEYKPCVIAIPDIRKIDLNGDEDFLILACDGLWDFVSEEEAARTVYRLVLENPDDTEPISQRLVNLASRKRSTDNISVIVVFLREPSKIAAEAHRANRNGPTTMDAGLDNANASNTFANSNADIPRQNDGFLLDFDGDIKINGTEKSPVKDFHSEKSNGKCPAFKPEDDDLGPETDVDPVEDRFNWNNSTTIKSMAEDIVKPHFDIQQLKSNIENKNSEHDLDFDLQRQQSSEFDGARSPREETPTPPADAVHDVGLVDNVADSGEDSEDEWNYYKGDSANKENSEPSKADIEVAQITEAASDSNAMSQLNPDAAEFVPVSPSRGVTSPACQALINDQIISQSPRRYTGNNNLNINVPSLQEFETEVKSRPSDVELEVNGHEKENGQKLSTQELMQNLLNGKNIDDIEFQPNSTPQKPNEEFHFGPNAAPLTPMKLLDQSEALSTKAVYGDESIANVTDVLDTSAHEFAPITEQDPMSMSFYQDKDDDTNPFDLNKVQPLPDDVDEFLNKQEESSFNETISDLPLHSPLAGAPMDQDKIDLLAGEIASTPVVTDLDKPAEGLPEPQEKDVDLLACPISKSPAPELDSSFELIASPVQTQPKSPEPFEDFSKPAEQVLAQSPEPFEELAKPLEPEENYAKSPEPAQELAQSPEPTQELERPLEPTLELPKSPEVTEELAKSPEPTEELSAKSPEPLQELAKSPAPSEEIAASPVPSEECAKSPIPAETAEPKPSSDLLNLETETCQRPESISPVPQSSPLPPESPVPNESACQIPQTQDILSSAIKTPEPEFDNRSSGIQSPEPEALINASSPEPSLVKEELKEEITEILTSPSPVEDVTSSVKDEVASPEPKEILEVESEKVTAESLLGNEHTLQASDINLEEASDVSVKVNDIVLETNEINLEKSGINFTEEISHAIQETVSAVEENTPKAESTPKSDVSDQVEIESVATTDINSFLERSNVPEIESPLSVNSEALAEKPLSIDEASKTLEEKSTNIADKIEEIKENIAPKIATAPLDKKKPATQKPETKTAPATKKPAPPKPAAKMLPQKTTAPKTAAPKPAALKPPTAKPSTTTSRLSTSPATAPKTAPTKPRTSLEKKPLTNGDVKSPMRSTLAAKKATETAAVKKTSDVAKLSPRPATALKASPKVGESKVNGRPATAPATAPAKPATITRAAPAPKARPTTLSARSTASSAAKTVPASAASKVLPTTKTETKTATSPKSATTTTAPKPRPAPGRVSLTKTITKNPEAEKQNKDSVNKTLTSRTTTTRTATSKVSSTSTTIKKTDVKAPTTRTTTTTKTTITALKPGAKKPETIARKTKTTTTKPAPKPTENGISVVEEIKVETSIVKEEQLVKDNSPIDSNILLQSNAAD